MNDIQSMWNEYKLENCSNNMISNKIKRQAFYAGAEAMRDHIQAGERLASEFISEHQIGLELVGGTDSEADR